MGEGGSRLEDLRALAKRLELDISDLDLLDQALTHSSATADAPELVGHNESLEFLGDAVLGLAAAQWLYREVPEKTPGEYTQMRAQVVNRKTLVRVANSVDIAPAIRLGKGEEKAKGRSRAGLLADCLEAVIGAAYLDCGWDSAKAMVERVFLEELKEASTLETALDYRSQLQQYCQAQGWPLPDFSVVSESGPDHKKEFEVSVSLRGEVAGQGSASTKKEAEQHAARAALEHEDQLN